MLWEMDSGKPLAVLNGHRGPVRSVAFSPDGKQLASVGEDETLILWDVAGRKPLVTATTRKDHIVQRVIFSPDGKWLAWADTYSVILWDVASRKLLATLTADDRRALDVAFSPDGKRLASAGDDITLWDMDSRKPLATLKGHGGLVNSVAFSPDGKRLASASEDKTVILWDVDSRKPLARLAGYKGSVSKVAFSPDEKCLGSAGDGGVYLWDLDLSDLRTEACRTANRNLTCDEWRTYIGSDKPYHKTCPALPGPEKCE
ncbi:MAG TPA: WD40 repeat domain-containing protein [Thermoanaerobaculia bacterium]|jgi:WD40 repeat protein|nr:WD40 repeat domain-containing protein [Thermoanaerobaculia bacterium]